MADVTVASLRKDIDNRLKGLKPLVDEYHRLEEAARALQIKDRPGTEGRSEARQKSSTRKRRGRSNRDLILGYLAQHESGTAGQVAQATGANRNALATALSALAKEGLLERAERGYRLAKQDGSAEISSTAQEASEQGPLVAQPERSAG